MATPSFTIGRKSNASISAPTTTTQNQAVEAGGLALNIAGSDGASVSFVDPGALAAGRDIALGAFDVVTMALEGFDDIASQFSGAVSNLGQAALQTANIRSQLPSEIAGAQSAGTLQTIVIVGGLIAAAFFLRSRK